MRTRDVQLSLGKGRGAYESPASTAASGRRYVKADVIDSATKAIAASDAASGATAVLLANRLRDRLGTRPPPQRSLNS
jgi:hypothetical protein